MQRSSLPPHAWCLLPRDIAPVTGVPWAVLASMLQHRVLWHVADLGVELGACVARGVGAEAAAQPTLPPSLGLTGLKDWGLGLSTPSLRLRRRGLPLVWSPVNRGLAAALRCDARAMAACRGFSPTLSCLQSPMLSLSPWTRPTVAAGAWTPRAGASDACPATLPTAAWNWAQHCPVVPECVPRQHAAVWPHTASRSAL